MLWKVWAPVKAKILSWLLHQNRLWCNDRLQWRGWVNGYFCHLCFRNLESSFHLFWGCNVAVAVAIWNQAASWNGCSALKQENWANAKASTETASCIINCSAPRQARGGIKSMIILITSEIWQ